MTTPNAGLPELAASQAQPHIPVNSALRLIDALMQLSVLDIAVNAPVGGEVDGDSYLVGDTPAGAFSEFAESDIAVRIGGGWTAVTPKAGWRAYVQSLGSLHIFSTDSPGIWEEFAGGGGGGATEIAMGMFFPGGPPGSSQLIFKFAVHRDIEFPADFDGINAVSFGHIGTNPASSFVMSVRVNNAEIGTITVSTGGAYTFETDGNAPQTADAGDYVTIVAPSSADGTAADIAATLVAYFL